MNYQFTNTEINKLKTAGFKSYEISHLKAGRIDRVSKSSLQLFKKLFSSPKKKCYNKPIIIYKDKIKLKPFIKLKPIGENKDGKKKIST